MLHRHVQERLDVRSLQGLISALAPIVNEHGNAINALLKSWDDYVGDLVGLGTVPRVLAASRPNQTLSNSTTNDQNFNAVYQLPAGFLVAQRVVRVDLHFQWVTDAAASTQLWRLKLGGSTVVTMSANTPSNNATHGQVISYYIFGTAAAGAAVNVDSSVLSIPLFATAGSRNVAAQPIALATNGTLDIIPAVQFGTNTNGESLTLLDALVTKVN